MKPITVSIKKFCKLTGVGRSTAFSLIREGEIDAVRIGRRKTLVTYASVEKLIERNAQKSEPLRDEV
ncbi:MAG: helix-turn-helix domain-containing protein [Sphingomonadaceae bacterium]|nr:helix-turn-helix domain-containing protein [Sphingomonadaceae bacterium]